MQGLWSTHRRTTKLNLNSLPPTPPTEDAAVSAPPAVTPQPASDVPAPTNSVAALQSPSLNPESLTGKRKTRSSRAAEGTSSKRTKLSSLSTGPGGGYTSKEYIAPSARLCDLGGVDACVEKMLELVAMPLCHPEVYLHTGVQPPRGVLLHGPPGCGKTLLANAMAGVSFPYPSNIKLINQCIGTRDPIYQHFCPFNRVRNVRRI
jgi:ribosome biogenesis ATPase